jgi:hypothetical protein
MVNNSACVDHTGWPLYFIVPVALFLNQVTPLCKPDGRYKNLSGGTPAERLKKAILFFVFVA